MDYFPAFVRVTGRRVVVVGGGEIAAQRLRLLVKTSAAITLIDPAPGDAVRQVAASGGVALLDQPFHPDHLNGTILVFAASDEPETNSDVASAATARGIAVNVADRPGDSSFIVPAIIDRDPVVVAIGSEGTAPALARELKSRIEAWLPFALGEVARRAGALRTEVRRRIGNAQARRRFWTGLLDGPWRDAVLNGDRAAADRALDREIEAVHSGAARSGRVSLVGAGPGDPDLMTLKAQQRLQQADVIVVDGLVPAGVLEYARREAVRIHVGKSGYGDSIPQSEIDAILVREAGKGHRVVRLKSGDPFVFGRAAEELAAVRAAGFEVDIVPGITAAHACAAAIGLPVTQRGAIRQFSIVTGATAGGLPDLDWQAMAQPGTATAVYMGVRTAGRLAARLLAAGADPALPVVIVVDGTRRTQRVIETALADLAAAVGAMSIGGPAIIFIGLHWHGAGLARPDRVERFVRAATQPARAPDRIEAPLACCVAA
jgi:uroporphyrin-III C-methyltransferase/precorrin-2 dehydrogenase/sirohydrochlorin ferrochelatase